MSFRLKHPRIGKPFMGGETPYVDYAIIALVVIIFGVLVGFSFKVWRVLHALLVISVFLATGCFIAIGAAALKTQTVWHKVQEDYALRVAQEQAELEKILTGLPGDADEAKASRANSLAAYQQMVSRILIGRGLVWRGMLRSDVTQTADGFVSVTLKATFWGDGPCISPNAVPETPDAVAPPAEEPVEGEEPAEDAPAEEDAGPTARRHGLVPGMLVFAFQEQPATAVGVADLSNLCRLPQIYLGQFQVVASEADSLEIELVSLLPRDEILPGMLQAIEQPSNAISWTLYQTMPTDRHDLFAGMNEAELQHLLPKTYTEYARHLQPVPADYDPAAFAVGDPGYIAPQSIWARVQFTKPHTIQVDTPAPAEGAAPAGEAGTGTFRYFDAQGLAMFPELRQGTDGTIAFEPGAEIVIPTAAAEALVAEGVAKQVERVYVRTLRQYQTQMAAARVALRRQQDKIAVLEIDFERQDQAVTQAEAQEMARKASIAALEVDAAGFRVEVEAVNSLKSQLTADYQNFREEYRQLYLSVKARAEELTRIHAEILQRVDSGETPVPAESPTDLASAEAAP